MLWYMLYTILLLRKHRPGLSVLSSLVSLPDDCQGRRLLVIAEVLDYSTVLGFYVPSISASFPCLPWGQFCSNIQTIHKMVMRYCTSSRKESAAKVGLVREEKQYEGTISESLTSGFVL